MRPDARCYGNAMRACAAGGNWQLSLALLNTMKKEGVTRTAFNYNIAMQVQRYTTHQRCSSMVPPPYLFVLVSPIASLLYSKVLVLP